MLYNDRTILKGKELDIYIPEYRLAIEFGAVYYHSKDHVGSRYHIQKYLGCKELGIKLITIFDVDWNDSRKRNIIKSRIKNALNRCQNRVYGRKCNICYPNSREVKRFLDKNHLQGYSPSSFNIGLEYENNLIAIATFGKPRFSKTYQWEIIRFCSKRNLLVLGGFSKIFKQFIKDKNPNNVISYADLRWGSGSAYANAGFKLRYQSEPSPWYTHCSGGKPLYHRMKVQKHRLEKLLSNFDPNESAERNLRNNNWIKVYDCGTNVWVWENETRRDEHETAASVAPGKAGSTV